MPDQLTQVGGPTEASLFAVQIGNRLDSHSLIPYAGPCPQSKGSMLSRPLTHFNSAKLDLHPDCTDATPFVSMGCTVETRFTFISNLLLDVESTAAPAVRRRARKAAVAGVEFDASVSAAEFLEIWQATCKRRQLGEFLNPKSLATLLDRITTDGLGEILGSRLPDGRLVAANVILYDDSSAYFWLSGFDQAEPHRGASNQFCHLQTLRRAAMRVSSFDWLGANTPGVTEYKASFGPKLVSYSRVRFSAEPPNRNRNAWQAILDACAPFRRTH
jgi:hypothetical protein